MDSIWNRFMYQLYYCDCVHYNYVATMLFVLYYYNFITTINFNLICMLNKIEENPGILDNIDWGDEASFKLSGHINRHNCVY